MGLTLNGGYGGGGGSYPTLEVTITNGTAASVTATLGSTVVNLTYAAGVWRGTLKAFGTWTVEASNGEKTVSDTVDVTSVAVYTASLQFSPLPSGYTELEYLKGTGTQYINTEYVPSSTTSVQIKFSVTNASTNEIWAIAIWNGSSYRAGLVSRTFYTDGGFSYDPSTYSSDTITIATANSTPSGFSTNLSFYMFVQHESSGAYHLNDTKTIYSCKIWSTANCTGTLVRDFIPARRNSDSVLGMYDLVTNTFYTNAGSGTFIAGPDV